MKILTELELAVAAGIPNTRDRDFSLYDDAPYECVCGRTHAFSQFSGQAFASTGASAKFLVQCLVNPNAVTLIKTTNKFFVVFDRFISLAGCIVKK